MAGHAKKMGDEKLAKKSRCSESGGEKMKNLDQNCKRGLLKRDLEREGEEWRKIPTDRRNCMEAADRECRERKVSMRKGTIELQSLTYAS